LYRISGVDGGEMGAWSKRVKISEARGVYRAGSVDGGLYQIR
jgi:hypothetical protein